MPGQKIVPSPSQLTEPYWSGCREGVLQLQQCDDCERYQFYPRTLCSHCGSREMTWRGTSGRGRIASYTVVHRPLPGDYPNPLIVVLIDLDEGPRMMSSLVDSDPQSVSVGAPVAVDFESWSDDISMPVFRIVLEEGK